MAALVPGPLNSVAKPSNVKDGTSPLQPGSPPVSTGTAPGGSPTAATARAAGPCIQIDPPKACEMASDQKPVFAITAAPAMPVFSVTFKILGAAGVDPTPATDFSWTATISFDSSKCPHGLDSDGQPRKVAPVQTSGTAKGGNANVDLTRIGKIRGGDLKIVATATVGGQLLRGETQGWRVQGTNPSSSAVDDKLVDDTHRRIACAESGKMQFLRAPDDGNVWYPYFSEDNMLGAGICQLTNPEPSPDQLWDWTKNIAGGVALFKEKRSFAQKYPKAVANSQHFKDLVVKYNELLKAQGLGPAPIAGPTPSAMPGSTSPVRPGLSPMPVPGPTPSPAQAANVPAHVDVVVPEFNADELGDDTIRGFNGYAGNDGFTGHLHEFRIVVDAATGNLVVTGDPRVGKVFAKWEKVPVSARPKGKHAGDPNYVNDVNRRDPKTCAKS